MDTWNEYGRWVDKEDLDGLAKSKDELVRMAKSKGLNIVRWGKDETNGNNIRPVLEVKDKKIMKDSRAKVKSFLAQEFRDLKARLSKKVFKDNKPKSQREVWLNGLSSIKDSLQRFKDKSEFYRNNGYRIQITELNDYIEYIVFDPKGAYRALKKESGFSSEREALKAAEAYTNSLPHSDRWKDANWSEGKHKRDKNGKFSSTGGGGRSAEESESGKSTNKSPSKEDVHMLFNLAGKNKYYQKAWNAGVDLNDLEEDDIAEEDKELYNEVQNRINALSNKIIKQGGKLTKEDEKECDYIEEKANQITGNDEFDEDDFDDSAEYINDRKIDIKKDGKLIDTVNAESLDEAVRIYERQHPELRGQIDAYFSDAEVTDARIDFDKDWAERMFNAGYTARETAMRVKGYQESENPDEQRTLISELEQLRKAYFERKRAEKRSTR